MDNNIQLINYLKKKYLYNMAFLDVKANSVIKDEKDTSKYISVPILYNTFEKGIKSGRYSVEIPIEDIIEGIVVILICDDTFKLRKEYLHLVDKADPKIENYLNSTALNHMAAKNYDLSFCYFEFLARNYYADKSTSYNKALSFFNIINNSSDEEFVKNSIDDCINMFEEIKKEDSLGCDFLGHLYLNKKEYTKAYNNYEVYIAQYNGDLNSPWYKAIITKFHSTYNIIQFEYGVFNFENKKYSKALEYFLSIIDNNESWYALLFLIGKCYRALKNIDDAIEYFKRCYRLDSKNSDLLNEMGLCYYLNKDMQKAKKFIEDAINLDQDNVIYIMNLCTLNMEEGNYDKALALNEQALRISPEDDVANKCKEIILNKINERNN